MTMCLKITNQYLFCMVARWHLARAIPSLIRLGYSFMFYSQITSNHHETIYWIIFTQILFPLLAASLTASQIPS